MVTPTRTPPAVATTVPVAVVPAPGAEKVTAWPLTKLLPPAGTSDRYRAQEWLNYVATELHKGIGALFNPNLTDPWKQVLRQGLAPKLDFLTKRLEGKSFAFGDGFSANPEIDREPRGLSIPDVLLEAMRRKPSRARELRAERARVGPFT